MEIRESVARVQERLGALRARIQRHPHAWLVGIVLALAAAPRIWTMWFDQGVFWPDEIYQSIEQAHRAVFGYGFRPWEFRDGARSWVYPGMLAGVLKLGSLIGLSTGESLVKFAKSFMVLIALFGVAGSMRLGKQLSGPSGALIAGAAAALYPPSIVYGSRCMNEMAAGPLLVWAASLALDKRWKGAAIAGVLSGTAIFMRYQTGLVGVGIFFMLLFSRAWKPMFAFAGTGTLTGILGGWIDELTWGRWYHSFLTYWDFNVVQGKAEKWGVSDFSYYFDTLPTASGPMLYVLLGGLVIVLVRARILPLLVVAFAMAHAYVPHKEFRFLMPVAPLFLGLGGAGLGLLFDPLTRAGTIILAKWAGVLASLTAMVVGLGLSYQLLTITFEDMGSFIGSPVGQQPPWHHEEGPNLAFWEAGKQPDLCGIAMVGVPLISSGGYSYLHRDVPILGSRSPYDLEATNYLAMPRLMPPPDGYRMVKGFDDFVLLKRDGPCGPVPAWFVRDFP